MSGDNPPRSSQPSRWLVFAILLGLYLTFRGYHSFDGDQAYRLPLLLHRQDPKLYAGDPFVTAVDAFNPHSGWLLVLDLVTRPLGVSAGLFLIFALTFAATCLGIDRLARGVWPQLGPVAGLVAVILVLAAKAGNIGTNHIFEAMVLDRQIAFALGWMALAQLAIQPDRGRPLVMAAIGVATLVHPSAGLQLALVLSASSAAWCVLHRWTEVSYGSAFLWIAGLAAAVIPGAVLNLGAGPRLMGEMPASDFWLLSVELQSPQHMLPHLWRMPQWLACVSYLALAALAVSHLKIGRSVGPRCNDHNASIPFAWPAVRCATAHNPCVDRRGSGRRLVSHREATHRSGDSVSAVPHGDHGAGDRPAAHGGAGRQPVESGPMAAPNASDPACRLGHRRLADGRRDPCGIGCLSG